MQVLAWMWCIIFSMWVGSVVAFGISAIAHALLIAGVFITAGVFEQPSVGRSISVGLAEVMEVSMNRFIIDREPEAIAQQLCDQHIIKMVLEKAQMLNTAVRLHAPEFAEESWLVQDSVQNHPCTQWARETRVNYRLLCV